MSKYLIYCIIELILGATAWWIILSDKLTGMWLPDSMTCLTALAATGMFIVDVVKWGVRW